MLGFRVSGLAVEGSKYVAILLVSGAGCMFVSLVLGSVVISVWGLSSALGLSSTGLGLRTMFTCMEPPASCKKGLQALVVKTHVLFFL